MIDLTATAAVEAGDMKAEDYAKAQNKAKVADGSCQEAPGWPPALVADARAGRSGKRGEARELLAPVYGWCTEGFDTRGLKDAKALLDDLAA
jgi:predicted ATPase